MIIRDRIDYTVQNLLISKYEHQMAHILKFNEFCQRDDVFAVLMRIYNSETEEEYLHNLKTYIAFVKLVAPEIIELYTIHEKLMVFYRLVGYDLEFDHYKWRDRKRELEKMCDEHL